MQTTQDSPLTTLNGWVREAYLLLLTLLIVTFQTEPQYVFTFVVLSIFRIITGTLFVNGERKPGGWGRFLGGCGDTLRVVIVLAVVTALGNMQTPFGWIIDAGYTFFCGRLVRITINNLSTTESDLRRFFAWIADEVLRRNRMVLDVNQIASAERQANQSSAATHYAGDTGADDEGGAAQ